MFGMFGRKGPPRARECRTAARHFLAREGLLWRIATFESSLGAARHSLAGEGGGLCTLYCEFRVSFVH